MRTHGWIAAVVAAMTALGCNEFGGGQAIAPVPAAAAPPATMPAAGGNAAYLTRSSVKPEGDAPADNAVDTALQWAQRYADVAEKTAKLQQENRDFQDRQQKLQDANSKLQADLTSAQLQLKEANAMLMDMKQELEKWKASVLGFRQEMREAQQAQLVALTRIMKLLGGEPVPAAGAATTQPAAGEPVSVGKDTIRETPH